MPCSHNDSGYAGSSPITAGAAEEPGESVSAKSGDFEYELDDDILSITGYSGNAENLTIPSEIDGYTVTEIGWNAFSDNTSLTSITIPDTVTFIGDYALLNCKNLTSVTIPDSVTYIGDYAFENTALSSINISASVKYIGENAFGYVYDEDSWDYVKDESFTIYGYTNSEAYAYARENGFKFVSLGEVSPFEYEVYDDDVASITDYNGSDANVTIPSTIDGYNVTEIGWSAFENCTSLKSVEIPEAVTYIGWGAFENCTSLKSVEIPETVTYIDGSAFKNCTSLKSVTIPASVKYIGEYAFGYTFDDDSWEYIKSDSFTIYGYTYSEAYVYAKDNGFKFVSLGEVSPFVYEVYDDVVSITDYNGSDANVTIPSTIDGYNVTEIGWSAFKNCTSLTSVEIPETVTYIDDSAFENCTSLKSVTIPASVKYIGEHALGYVYDEYEYDYVKVESFTIYGYTYSEAYAYARNNSINFVSLGEVSPYEYYVCYEYKDEYEDIKEICISDYNGDETNLTIPSTIDGYTVTEIGENAFENCTSLNSVGIPETVTYIGEYAFVECTNLKSVTIPASVKYIDEFAFGYTFDDDSWEYIKSDSFTIYGYTNSEADLYARVNDLKFVSLGEVSPFLYEVYDDVASITDYNGSDANVTIPSEIDGYTVTEIARNAFKNCTSLTSVEIPETVTYIDDSAFENCTSLKSVTIPASVKYIGEHALGYVYDEDSWDYVKDESFTIYGYTNSEAYAYARENGFKFVSLGEVSPFVYEAYDDVASITDYNGSEANLTIPSTIDGYNVTEIGWSAFKNCTSLKSVEIPETVTYIGGYAFADCTNIKSVTIPASVKYIGEYAFADCTNIKSVTIPASLINIGDCAFGYVYDEDSCEYVKDESFTIYGYTNSEADLYARVNDLKFVSLGEVSPFLYEVYDDVVFIIDYNGSEANLTIPSEIDGYTVTGIDWNAFENCTSLTSVEIPETVTYIGGSAFENCTSLKSVEIPETVMYIYDYAFADCTNLKSVSIPEGVDYIGDGAFGYFYDEDSCEYVKGDNFTINGYTGSEAEKYAKENGFKFVSLGIDPTQKLGDVNGDGKISIDDATAVQKYLANMLDLTDRQAELADVNMDGDITIDDVTLVQKYLAGLAEI